MPSQPGAPTWITSSETSISIEWTPAEDNGGCPITEYKVYRDDGEQVMASSTAGLPYVNSIIVNEFPINSVG